MATLFTRIVNGEVPCHKVYEDDRYMAFLDIRPVNPGHTLVITKQEIDYIFDVDDELLSGLMVCAKKIARAIKQAVPCKKIGVMVAGIEVPHVHVHLIPIVEVADLSFARAKAASNEVLAEMAQKIRAHIPQK